MKKVPLSLIAPLSPPVGGGQPLVWNGLEFQLSVDLSLADVHKRIKEAAAFWQEITQIEQEQQTAAYRIRAQIADIQTWYDLNRSLLPELTDFVQQSRTNSKELVAGLAPNERLIADTLIDLAEVKTLCNYITSGKFVQGDGVYTVAYVKDQYRISRTVTEKPSLLSNYAISLDVKGKATKISYNPYAQMKLRAGTNVYITTNEYYSTVNLMNCVRGSYSIEVDPVANRYLIAPKPTLILSSHSYVQAVMSPTLGFQIGVKTGLIHALNYQIKAGYGIIVDNRTLNVNPSVFTKLKEGLGVSVFSDDFNQYTIAFNQQTSGILNPYSLEARCPLSLNYETIPTSTFPDEVYTVSLNERYTATIQSILANALKSLQNIEHEISNVSFHNLSEGAKRRLACPLLYLYDLATVGKVSDNDQSLSATAKLLLQGFGTKPVNLDLLVDLQPMARLNPSGPGSGLGVEFSFNLFSALEKHLKTVLKNPSFTIKPEDKNSHFYILTVDKNSTQFSYKTSGEIGAVRYNTAWLPVRIVDSSTYPGRALTFTTGDMDFFRGVKRNGQSNDVPVMLTTSMLADLANNKFKIVIQNKVVEEKDGIVTYTLTVKDGYLNKTVQSVWSRPLQLTQYTLDYVTEHSTTYPVPATSANLIRLVSRLYANWQYNDKDLNLLIYLMSETAAELDKDDYITASFRDPSVLQEQSSVKSQAYSVVISKLDKNTGDTSLLIDTKVDIPFAYINLPNLLQAVKIPVTYKIVPVTFSSGSSNSLLSACCWNDLKYTDSVVCPPDDDDDDDDDDDIEDLIEDCSDILFPYLPLPTGAPTQAPTTTKKPTTTTTTKKPTTTTTKLGQTTTTTTKKPTTTTKAPAPSVIRCAVDTTISSPIVETSLSYAPFGVSGAKAIHVESNMAAPTLDKTQCVKFSHYFSVEGQYEVCIVNFTHRLVCHAYGQVYFRSWYDDQGIAPYKECFHVVGMSSSDKPSYATPTGTISYKGFSVGTYDFYVYYQNLSTLTNTDSKGTVYPNKAGFFLCIRKANTTSPILVASKSIGKGKTFELSDNIVF